MKPRVTPGLAPRTDAGGNSAGLIPFAVKLNRDLVAQVNALAAERKLPVNEVVAELLQAALKK